MHIKKLLNIGIIGFLSLSLYSCQSLDIKRYDKTAAEQERDAKYGVDRIFEDDSKLSDGLPFFGSKGAKVEIPILYTVALDKLSFMPLDSMDADGGIITTDWYDVANVENERVKFVVYILNDQINSDSINIKMFKQKFNGSIWRSAEVDSSLVEKMKASIINEAQRMSLAAQQS